MRLYYSALVNLADLRSNQNGCLGSSALVNSANLGSIPELLFLQQWTIWTWLIQDLDLSLKECTSELGWSRIKGLELLSLKECTSELGCLRSRLELLSLKECTSELGWSGIYIMYCFEVAPVVLYTTQCCTA